MNWNFRKKENPEPVINECTVPEKLPEKVPEKRGYFDTVATADAYVPISRADEAISTVRSPEQALCIATAFRCTDILSKSVAVLPLQLKRKRNGYFAPDEDDPINYALTVKPNYRQTAFELMRNAIIMVLNQGNAYIIPDWASGELRLTLLSPYSVNYDKIMDLYMVNDTVNNIYTTLHSEEIIHLRGFSLDGGYTGVSVITYASRVLGIAESADKKTLSDQQPGSSYKGFISGNNQGEKGLPNFQNEQLETVTERVDSELRSGKNIMYLQGDLKFNPLSMSPADIQLLETKKFSVLDICRFYGVHPDKVFAGQSQNYKASEMSQVQFLSDTLQPLLRQIENEFYAKLIPRKLAPKYKIEFDLEAFYQTDLESWSNYVEKTTQNGVYTVNYWRAKKSQPPTEGGDVPMVSCNVAPINSAKIKGENFSQIPQNLPPKNGDNTVG